MITYADLAPWTTGSALYSRDTMAHRFVRFFTEHMRCDPATEVTRVEWEYLPRPPAWPGQS